MWGEVIKFLRKVDSRLIKAGKKISKKKKLYHLRTKHKRKEAKTPKPEAQE